MKKRIKLRNGIILCLTMSMLFGFTTVAHADLWSVDYTAGAPSGSANPVDYVYVEYDIGGYYARCSSITGSSDKKVTITGIDVKMNHTVTFTAPGSANFTTTAASGRVGFKVAASASTNCSANGYII